MTTEAASLLLFTAANIGNRSIYRAVSVDLWVRPGGGKLWLDVSSGNGFEGGWQRHLERLAVVGRAHYDLAWDATDLFVSARGRGVVLDGASASLPIFVAWIALLASAPLPDPFFATGVAIAGSDALAPAPRAYIEGKIGVADAISRQSSAGRPIMYIPAGSDVDKARLSQRAVAILEVPTLRAAVQTILKITPRVGAPEARS